ncbi:MAG TPA: ABATE domain-containing protein [Gaiellaceae bacterium]|nr:ABATE domain-containing protein [Gaiellaceae bacterium]
MAAEDPDPPLLGGALCLDFANTVDARFPRAGTTTRDFIATYEQLVRWSRRAGALDAASARRLLVWAAEETKAARAAVSAAHRLREAIYTLFAAMREDREPPAPAAREIARSGARALERGTLVASAETSALTWSWPHLELQSMLWPIALSALELATSDEVASLKQCPGHDGRCGWLFLDRTKNQSRRWCTMQICGNAEKTRRQNARRRRRRQRPAARVEPRA